MGRHILQIWLQIWRIWPLLAIGLLAQGCFSAGLTATSQAAQRSPASTPAAAEIRTIPMAENRYETHEPDEMSMIAERAFSAKGTEDPWSDGRGEGWVLGELQEPWTIERDPNAPISPEGIARFWYRPGPVNSIGGYDPGTAERMLGSDAGSSVYLRTWIRYSKDFQGQSTGGDTLDLLLGNGKRVMISTQPRGFDGPIEPRVMPPDRTSGHEFLSMNVNTIFPQRGEWFQLEVLCELNSPGNRDGILRWWINGMLAGDYTDVSYNSAGESDSFTALKLNPIWGGAGESIRQLMWIDFDHLYLSTH